MDTIQVANEVNQLAWTMWPDDNHVIHAAKPADRHVGCTHPSHLFKALHDKLAMTDSNGKPTATPLGCS
jgi:hypothetical protein